MITGIRFADEAGTVMIQITQFAKGEVPGTTESGGVSHWYTLDELSELDWNVWAYPSDLRQ